MGLTVPLYLIRAGKIVYDVANNPATRKWARTLIRKGLAKKIKKPTPSQIKKANPLTTNTMKKQSGQGKGIEAAKKYLYKTDKEGKFKRTPQTDEWGDPIGKLVHLKKTRLKPAKILKGLDIAAAGGAGVAGEKIISAAKKRNKSTKEKMEETKKKKYVKPPKSVRKKSGGKVSAKKYKSGGRVAKYKG